MNKLFRIFKKQEPENVRETIEELIEEIDELIEDNDERDSSIQADERKLLGNVLNLRELTAVDVMIPRANIVAAPHTSTGEELIALMVEHGYSCLPIYQETLDHIIGFVHIKDIISFFHHKKPLVLTHLLKRNILGISPSMQTLDLLLDMTKSGFRIAIVADEHGGTDGMVFFSDLIEAIIGDIQNAYHIEPALIQINNDGKMIANARVRLDDIEETFSIDLKIEDEDVETLGGLIAALVNRVPVRGEIIKHPKGYEFEILDADPRRIKKVSILNMENINKDNT